MDSHSDSQSSNAHDSEREVDQDNFEDAQDITPRPSSSSVRSLTSASRSSSTMGGRASETPPPVPPLSKADADDEVKGQNGEEETPSSKTTPESTAQRVSVASMDDVSLQEGSDTGTTSASPSTHVPSSSQTPKLPPRQISSPPHTATSVSSPSTTVPPNFCLPELMTSNATPRPPPRKLTSPFSWLSRSTGSNEKKATPPAPTSNTADKRNTTSSVSTFASGSEVTGSRTEDGNDSDGSGRIRSNGSSLRDRFKVLRMQEEAGISPIENNAESPSAGGGSAIAGWIGRTTSMGLGIGSPLTLTNDKDDPLSAAARRPSVSGSISASKEPVVNPNLAPGTAAGIAVGPATDAGIPVDWDLWQAVVNEGPAAVRRTSAEELNRAIASGIPHAIRGVVWQVLAESKNEELEMVYRDLVARNTEKDKAGSAAAQESRTDGHVNGVDKEKDQVVSSASSTHSEIPSPSTTGPNGVTNGMHNSNLNGQAAEKRRVAKEDAAAVQKLEKAIRRDLGTRTSYSKYLMAAGLQEGLFGVCKAYALFDEAVGYAQGINFIAMPLLFNMPEEEAFCLLVRLMNKYGLRDLFTQDMLGLHLHLYQFERLLEDFEPALFCHLHRRGISPQLYATQWFLTLFAYRFPLQLVLRIYDLILSEGLETAILKFGIVLMQKNAQTLLSMRDMSALSTFLKERLFDVYIDKSPSQSSLLDSGFFGSAGGIDKEVYRADALVQDACAIQITRETLKSYETEWAEQRRLERERETELETLRSQNTALTLKVRVIEERAEKADADHVAAASALVRVKVESEELQDANESLRGQVAALQRIVESQPEEVERRLQSEMERIMQRNIEVQNENRALEEQLADAEKELVETKLRYAQVNSEHEELKQKCNNITMMLAS